MLRAVYNIYTIGKKRRRFIPSSSAHSYIYIYTITTFFPQSRTAHPSALSKLKTRNRVAAAAAAGAALAFIISMTGAKALTTHDSPPAPVG